MTEKCSGRLEKIGSPAAKVWLFSACLNRFNILDSIVTSFSQVLLTLMAFLLWGCVDLDRALIYFYHLFQ